MFSQSNRLFRLASVAVVALIATSVVALSVVLTHEDTAMAQGKPWPSEPAAAPSTTSAPASTSAPVPAPTTAQTSPVAENSPVASSPVSSQPKPSARGPITYTVKRGDNLTVIADWFKVHGYGDLYQANRKVIGSDPDLIRPGQKITISSTGMATSR